MFLEKLNSAEQRYREIEQMLTLPEVVSNNNEYRKLHSSMLAWEIP